MAALVLLAAGMASAGLYDAWGYKAQIQFSGYNKSETLTNFPALVVLSNNCFSGFAYSQFLSGSNDLAFTDATGTTNLNYEIDTWNASGLSYVWVQVPTMTSNSTITAWWGAPGQTPLACTTNGTTWTNGYVGVWHMAEAGTGTRYDSTSNTNDAVDTGATQAGGEVGYGINKTASQYLTASGAVMNNWNELTWDVWFRTAQTESGWERVLEKGANSEVALAFSGSSAGCLEVQNGGSSIFSDSIRTDDQNWHYAVVRLVAASGGKCDAYLYVDGAQRGSALGQTFTKNGTSPLNIGRYGGGGYAMNGYMDEVRVSTVARSANWVWACYLNMASNGVFNTYGAAGQINLSLPQVSDGVAQNLSNTSADVVGTLITNGSSATTVYLYCATNDCGTNAANWAADSTVTTNIGPFTSGAVFTNTFSGLTPNTVYFWNLMASNSAGVAWGATTVSPSFKTYGPPAVNNGVGATGVGHYSATLNGHLTSGLAADVYVLLGTADGVWTSTNYLGFLSDTPGVFSTNVTGLAAGTKYYYQCFASNAYGTVWAASSTNFTTYALNGKWYVTPGGAGVNDGLSWGTAFGTVQAAVNAATDGDTICLAGQVFSNNPAPQLNSQIVWTNKSLTILGGYAGSGTPGALTNTPTVLTQAGGGTNRIFYIGGVTNGVLQGLTVTGGYLSQADYGAGLRLMNCQGIAVLNCTISNNAIAGAYASSSCGGGLYGQNSGLTLSNCILQGNSVVNNIGGNNYGYGGAICVDGGTCAVIACELRGNTAVGSGGYGVGRGGAIYKQNAGLLQVQNCLIIGNDATGSSTSGDGVDISGGTATVASCTIVCNGGVGVQREGGTLAVTNSILWGNVVDATGTLTLAYCDVQAADANVTQNNCFSIDPQFERGLYLAAGSPCVNAGSDTAANLSLSALTTRADGMPDSGTVDLGYHYTAGNNASVADLYVSPTGSDTTGNGSSGNPYATITKALSLQQTGTRVHLAAGTYSAVSGETLPLTIVKDGVQLLGTNAALTQVSGGGAKQVLAIVNSCGDTRVEGVTIVNGYNTGTVYGGGVYANLSNLRIANCLIRSNTVINSVDNVITYGGGVYAGNCSLTISNSTFNGNRADGSYGNHSGCGGGLFVMGGVASVAGCVFSNNVTGLGGQYSSPDCGAGMYLNGICDIRNCLVVTNNSVSYGDGVQVGGGAVTLINCTVANNGGEGMRQGAGTATATNSIFWGNGVDVTGAVALAWCDAGTVGTGVTVNANCLSVNPMFTGNGSYTLQKTSPCIDAGVNQSWMTGALDLAGQPRIQGPKVDMGAYEAAYTPHGTTVFFR